MRFGYWTPLPTVVGTEAAFQNAPLKAHAGQPDPAWELALQAAELGERLGFDTTLILERFQGPDLEAFMLASALASRTTSIEILTAAHSGIINPQVIAKMGTAVDRISRGRFSINVINGWWKEEFQIFGNGTWIDRNSDRYTRMSEFIQVLKGLWTEEDFSFAGQYFNFENCRMASLPARQPRIYATARSEDGMDVVAEHCDVWFASYPGGRESYEANVTHLAGQIRSMRERAQRFGRTLDTGIMASIVSGDTKESAEKLACELEAFGKNGSISALTASGMGAGLVGTPDMIAERIRRYEDMGIDLLMLSFTPMIEGMQYFGEKIMPLLGGSARLDRQGRLAMAPAK